MARAKRASDEAYNARRRLKRQAERYKKQAATASASKASRLQQQAKYLESQASRLYQGKDTAKNQARIQAQSYSALQGTRKDTQKRRDIEAAEIMKTNVGAKIYGATVSIWQDSPYTDRNKALIEHFGVTDMMGVIELFEREFGEDLYKDDDSPLYRPSEMLALRAILAFGL